MELGTCREGTEPPLDLIEDICEDLPAYDDRRLALWPIADLP